MKIKRFLGCLVLVTVFAATASAQLVAGSEEDQLFNQINAAGTPDEKIRLCLQFEERFPNSRALPSVYTVLMTSYGQQNDGAKVIEYGEKVIAIDPENVNALMTVSRGLAVARQDLPKAVSYGERAVAAVAALQGTPAPPNYTDEQWADYLASTTSAAQGILGYARSVQ